MWKTLSSSNFLSLSNVATFVSTGTLISSRTGASACAHFSTCSGRAYRSTSWPFALLNQLFLMSRSGFFWLEGITQFIAHYRLIVIARSCFYTAAKCALLEHLLQKILISTFFGRLFSFVVIQSKLKVKDCLKSVMFLDL